MKRIFLLSLLLMWCFDNVIAQCPGSPFNITTQQQIDNFATDYPGCTQMQGDIYIIANSPITNLNGLSPLTSVDGRLFISGTDLTNLSGLNNLTSGGVLLIGNNSNLTDLSALNGLASANFLEFYNNGSLQNLDGLDNLTSLGYLQINQNPVLDDISALSNLDYNDLVAVAIYSNPNLSACSLPVLCSFLVTVNQQDSTSFVTNNDFGCNDIQDIISNCTNIAQINNEAFYDINQNTVRDAGEPLYQDAALSIAPSSLSTLFTNAPFYLNPGNYTVSYDLSSTPDWALTTSPSSYALSLNAGDVADLSFGVYPTQQVSDMQPLAISPNARCNDTITFDFSLKNLGTTTTDGTLWVSIDENVTSINFINPPDQTIPPNLYGWNFTDLFPSQIYTQEVELGVPGPPDFTLGNLLYFDTYANYTDVSGTQTTSVHEYHPIVLCSFDPNDKLVSPDRSNIFSQNYTLFGEKLTYTIRFQNTGNDVAYDVEIKDLLDANLDPASFQVMNSSHLNKLVTTLDNDGELTFTFNDIFLPDSTSNPVASQGYVTYSIDHNPGLAENTIINNFAEIYFDANPPIITNTTENVLVSELPTVSINEAILSTEISIIPNPNNGVFEVAGIEEGAYTISNTAGQILKKGHLKDNNSINIFDFPMGMYLITITTNNQVLTKRLIKS